MRNGRTCSNSLHPQPLGTLSFTCYTCFNSCLEMCYLRRRFAEQFADFTGRSYIGDAGALFSLKTSELRIWKLFLLKQTYESFLFLSYWDYGYFLSGWQCPASPVVNSSGWRSKPIVIWKFYILKDPQALPSRQVAPLQNINDALQLHVSKQRTWIG